jgi:Na+-driven multidrug efflux pump
VLLPFYMVEVGGIACLVGAGDTKTGMYVLATATVVNVPLATGLSSGAGFFPDLGFVGIAWGTGLSHVIGCGIVVTVLIRGRYGLRLTAAGVRPDRGLLYRLLRVSVPAAADSLSVGVFQFVFLGLINGLGETAAAAHGIAIQLEALGYLSGSAFGVAAGSIVGRSLGAGRPDLASRGGWAALLAGAAVMCGMGLVFFTLARPMFELFCRNPDQAGVIAAGVPVLRLIAFAMPGLAGQIVLTQALRGAGDTRVPVLFTWAGFALVRLPLAYLLLSPDVGIELGLTGAWVAMFADIYVRGILFVVRFAGGRWKGITV